MVHQRTSAQSQSASPTAALSDSDEPDSDAPSTGRRCGPRPGRAEAST